MCVEMSPWKSNKDKTSTSAFLTISSYRKTKKAQEVQSPEQV